MLPPLNASRSDALYHLLTAKLPQLERVYFFDEIDSTNRAAKWLIKNGAPPFSLVLTAHQTAGKGQGGKAWITAPGVNVIFTLMLRPTEPIEPLSFLPLLCSMAVRHAVDDVLRVSSLTPHSLFIKWPNDLYLNDKKMSGILIESVFSGSVLDALFIGIGINLNQTLFSPEVAGVATSLKNEFGHDFSHDLMLSMVLEELVTVLQRLRSGELVELKNEWKKECPFFNRPVRFYFHQGDLTIEKSGIVMDLCDNGALLIRTDEGDLPYLYGEISTLRF